MEAADLLSNLILILGVITAVVFLILTFKRKELRGLHLIIAFGCFGLAIVFGLNSFHVVTNAAGLTGGRPWTIIILSGVMGLGLYSLRNPGRRC
jgi:hypothetical protein